MRDRFEWGEWHREMSRKLRDRQARNRENRVFEPELENRIRFHDRQAVECSMPEETLARGLLAAIVGAGRSFLAGLRKRA